MNEREGVIQELFKNARRNYPRLNVIVKGRFETLSADLVDMQKYAKQNNGYKYILTVICNFSKWAWALPLRDKSGPTVTAAMETILKDIGQGPVKFIFTDLGKEFYNTYFQALLKKNDITLYSTYSGLKSPIIERFNRTLRHLMHPELLRNGNTRWVKILPSLLEKYNHTRHSTIKMAPADVNSENEKDVLNKIYKKVKIVQKNPKFKVGEFVRLSRQKLLFEKGYTQNYTFEIYRIAEVKLSNPRTYLLEDLNGEKVKGRFYEQELQATKYPETYLLEKIFKKKGNKFLVSYLGFPGKFWVNKKDIV